MADAVRAVGEVDVHALSEAGLVAGFESLLEAETLLRAAQARWLAAVDVRDATVAECGRAVRSWLVEELRCNPGDATRRLRLARELPAAPITDAAFAAGQIHAEHAVTVLAAVRQVPVDSRDDVEAALVQIARTQPPFVVARAVDQVLAVLGVESSAEAAYARRYAERGVDVAQTFGGFGSLSGTLAPDVAEALVKAVEAAAAPTGPDDDRSGRQRRHDGLGEVARFYLMHADVADSVGEPVRIVVTMPLEVLQEQLSARWATLDSGAPLAPQTARRLACDAEIIPAVLGSRGEVLDLGLATRVWSRAIRRAAKLRDGGRCAYGRCRRRIVELHHIKWWSRGGPTSLDNAAWLCAFHHWLVHEGGWRLRRDSDGGYTFTDTTGRERCFPRDPELGDP